MMQPGCPFLSQNPLDQQERKNRWHRPILMVWLWMALVGSLAWTVLSVTASGLGFLSIELGWIVAVVGQMALFMICLQMYSLRVRARFEPMDRAAGTERALAPRAMPTHGLFMTLFDVMVRRRTLLRDIDVERMRKYGDIYLMFAGPLPVIVVTSSALVEEISREYDGGFKTEVQHLPNRKVRRCNIPVLATTSSSSPKTASPLPA